jgi:K(+)-stimulated pyrophosphate-energized sodium pump
MAAIGLGLLGLTLLFIIFKDPDIISGFAFGVCFTMLFVHGKNGCENSSKKNEKSASKPCCTAGMTCAGADLFVSYICSILAAITLGAISLAFKGAILPVVISGFAVFASIFALSFVKMKENSNHIMSLRFASFVGIALMLAASYFIVKLWMPMFFGIFWAIVTGAAAGCIIRLSNGYYTCTKRKPVKNIAKALEIGIADGIISSMKVGLISAIFPLL